MTETTRLSIITPCRPGDMPYLRETILALKQIPGNSIEHIILFLGDKNTFLEQMDKETNLALQSMMTCFDTDEQISRKIITLISQAQGKWSGILYPGSLLLGNVLTWIQQAEAQGSSMVLGRVSIRANSGKSNLGIVSPNRLPDNRTEILPVWKPYNHPVLSSLLWETKQIHSISPGCIPEKDTWLDFFLFCVLSQNHPYLISPEVLVSIPYLPDTVLLKKLDHLEEGIRLSIAHSPPRFSLEYLRLRLDLWRYRYYPTHKAVLKTQQIKENWHRGRYIVSLLQIVQAILLSPKVFFHVLIFPSLQGWIGRLRKI